MEKREKLPFDNKGPIIRGYTGYEQDLRSWIYEKEIRPLKNRIMELKKHNPEIFEQLMAEYQALLERFDDLQSSRNEGSFNEFNSKNSESIFELIGDFKEKLEITEQELLGKNIGNRIDIWIKDIKSIYKTMEPKELVDYLNEKKEELNNFKEKTSTKLTYKELDEVDEKFAELHALIISIYVRKNNGISTLFGSGLIQENENDQSEKDRLKIFLGQLDIDEEDRRNLQILEESIPEFIYSPKVWEYVANYYSIPIKAERDGNFESKEERALTVVNGNHRQLNIHTDTSDLKKLKPKKLLTYLTEERRRKIEESRLKRGIFPRVFLPDEYFISDIQLCLRDIIHRCEELGKEFAFEYVDAIGKRKRAEIDDMGKLITFTTKNHKHEVRCNVAKEVFTYLQIIDELFETNFLPLCLSEIEKDRTVHPFRSAFNPQDNSARYYSRIYEIAEKNFRQLRKYVIKNMEIDDKRYITRDQYYDSIDRRARNAPKDGQRDRNGFKAYLVCNFSGTIKFLKELSDNDFQRLLTKEKLEEFERERLKREGKEDKLTEEEVYIPDYTEYIFDIMMDIKNVKDFDRSFNRYFQTDIELRKQREYRNRKFEFNYTSSNGLRAKAVIKGDRSVTFFAGEHKKEKNYCLNPHVLIFLKKLDNAFHTDYLGECLRVYEEFEPTYAENKNAESRSEIYQIAMHLYNLIYENEPTFKRMQRQSELDKKRKEFYTSVSKKPEEEKEEAEKE